VSPRAQLVLRAVLVPVYNTVITPILDLEWATL